MRARAFGLLWTVRVLIRCLLSEDLDSWRKIAITLIDLRWGFSMSVNAFHEKAGRSQVGSFVFSLDKCFFSPPSRHCRHPSIRTLNERFCFTRCKLGVLVSAGAATCLSTSLSIDTTEAGQAINAVTETRLWGFFVF